MKKPLYLLVFLSVVSLALLGLAPFVGLTEITNDVVREQILFDIRLPRALFAFVAGSGLALCGMVFQAMFHNPLATPFTLGVASGASFGAAVTVFLGLSFSLLGFDAVTAVSYTHLTLPTIYSV